MNVSVTTMPNLAVQRRHRRRSIVQGIGCKFHRCRQSERKTDTRKALAKAIRSCRTESRDKLFVTATRRPWLATRKTLSSRDWITLIISWSRIQETGPTPTSAAIPRAVKRSDCCRSPSTSKTLRSCSSINHCSQHIDDIFQAAPVRPSVNQVEYHIGLEDVDDGSRDRSIDASRKRVTWTISIGSLKSPRPRNFQMHSREQCVSSVGNT